MPGSSPPDNALQLSGSLRGRTQRNEFCYAVRGSTARYRARNGVGIQSSMANRADGARYFRDFAGSFRDIYAIFVTMPVSLLSNGPVATETLDSWRCSPCTGANTSLS